MRDSIHAALASCALLAGCTAGARGDLPEPHEDEQWISRSAFEKGEAEVAEARTQVLPQAIVAGGRLAFDDARVSHVFSPVTGRVTRILAQLGQQVKKGTPLVAVVSPDVGM